MAPWSNTFSRHVTAILFTDERESLALLTIEGHGWSQSVRRDSWSPAYGRREIASVVNFGAQVELPADFATLVVAGENSPTDLGRLVKAKGFGPKPVCGYQYSDLRQEHSFFFSDRPGPWALGAWASDADFLYWSVDRQREQYSLVLCNGSYADVGDRRVLTCSQAGELC